MRNKNFKFYFIIALIDYFFIDYNKEDFNANNKFDINKKNDTMQYNYR